MTSQKLRIANSRTLRHAGHMLNWHRDPWFWAFGLAWAAFCVWTLNRLWRPANSEFSKVVYLYGVKRIGVTSSILTPILMWLQDWGTNDPGLARFMFITSAWMGPPLWLWAGYVSGRILAHIMGLTNDS